MDRFPLTSWDPKRPDLERLLRESKVEDSALIASASNYVFLLGLRDEAAGVGFAVYKPARGETPLWDFPPDIYKREVASFLVSSALGWGLVPPTVIRADGLPHGPGSLQAFIPTDHSSTFFDLREGHPAAMRRFAAFDWLTNNADRKGGHVLLGPGGHLWGIDNALSFHPEEKLRTVIWDYAGEPIPDSLLADIEMLSGALENPPSLSRALAPCLSKNEIDQLAVRAAQILRERTFPHPPDWRRPYPWPLI